MMRQFLSKLRAIVRRDRLSSEMAEEVAAHIALMTDDFVASGMSEEEARRRARREFGNQLSTRERAYEAWQFPRVEEFLGDLRHGLRGIRRAPTFSAAVLITLALGIGATTSIFSVVYAVLLRPLPYPEADRLVWIGESAGEATGISVTWANHLAWRERTRTLDAVAPFIRGANRTLTGEGDPQVASGWMVSHELFDLAGLRAGQGRLFGVGDDRADAPPTVVLSHEFATRALGGGDVVGRSVMLDDRSYEVVGVLEPGATFMEPGVDFYLPIGLFFTDTDPRNRHGSIRLIGRLAPGATVEGAMADLDEIMQRLALADPGPENDHRSYVESLTQRVRGDVADVLWLILGAVALVLVLACANVASLLLGRSVRRRSEMAIRAAIGAGRGRLARQLLTETLAITAIGGVLGVGVAYVGLRVLVSVAPAGLPRLDEIGLDVTLLAFAALVTLVVGLLSGLAPLRAATGPLSALKEGRSAAGAGRAAQRARGILVVTEVAITVVLAFASTLLVRSLILAQGDGIEFDAEHILAVELRLPAGAYPDHDARHRFYETFTDRLRQQQGVESVAAMGCPPLWGNCGDWWYSVNGRPEPEESEVPIARLDYAEAGVFGTLGLPLLAGREFMDGDSELSAVVNETLARTWWSSPEDAIGGSIKIGGPYQQGSSVEVIGVARNAAQSAPDQEAVAAYWLPAATNAPSRMVVLARTTADPAALTATVRQTLREFDARLPIWSMRPLDEVVAETLEGRRFTTWLLTLFAALATLLAVVGAYGVIQQWVTARRAEIAIRMVMGARRQSIAGWVGRHAVRLIGAGLAVGLVGALASARLLRGVVFGVSPADPLTLVAVGLGVVALAAGGAALPVVRASRLDPGRELETR